MLGHAAVVECRGQNEEFSVFFDGSSCTVEPKESRQKWPIDDIYAKNCKITADTISVYWKHDLSPTRKKADMTTYETVAKVSRGDGSFVLEFTNDDDDKVVRIGGTCRRRTGDAF